MGGAPPALSGGPISSGCGTDGSESVAEVPTEAFGARLGPLPEPFPVGGAAVARTTRTTTEGGGRQQARQLPMRPTIVADGILHGLPATLIRMQ